MREKVVSYPHTQGATTDDLVQNCLDRVEEGWKFVRWGQPETSGAFEQSGTSRLEPIESMRLAVDQMSKVREAVGPDIQILLDAHTRLDTAHTVQMCKDLEEFKPLLHRRPDTIRKPRLLQKPPKSDQCPHRRRRAVGIQMVLPTGHRRRAHRLRPHRSLHLSVASPKQQRSLTGQRLTTSTSCRTIR